MSKIEAGKTNLNLSEEKIADILDGIETIIRPQIQMRKYYASLLYEYDLSENQAGKCSYEQAKILGIDYAMHGMALFSDRLAAVYPGYLRQAEEKLAREQRMLSHCEKGSRNYRKQKQKVALCHEKVKNQRKDYIHKLTRKIADEYDAVGVEDIDMKAMSRCLNFGKSVMDNSYGMFRIREEARRILSI